MQKIPQITIYARQAGVAITPFERRSEGRPSEGRIVLRFFRLESGSSAIRFIIEPAEAFTLFGKIHKIVRDGGQESLNHSFAGPEGEFQTRLTVERWARNGKSGYAISVQSRRGAVLNCQTTGFTNRRLAIPATKCRRAG